MNGAQVLSDCANTNCISERKPNVHGDHFTLPLLDANDRGSNENGKLSLIQILIQEMHCLNYEFNI